MSAVVPRIEAPTTWKAYGICGFTAFGGLLFGYDSGYINGVLGMNEFKKDFGRAGSTDPEAYMGYMYASWEKSLITAILSAGTFLGALIAGYFADAIGRKITIQLGCLIYVAGVLMQTVAASVGLLSAGRGVAGLGVGFVSATVIMYVSEITPKKIRGTVIGCYQFAITIGLFLSACVNYGTKDRTDSGAYRIPIALQFAWALILGLGLLLLPESPRWYVMRNNPEKSRAALATLRSQNVNSPFVTDEHDELVACYNEEIALGAGSGGWLDCVSGGFKAGSNLHRTFIGTSVQVMQQLTGVNFIFYFGTTFFQQIGIRNSFIISIVLGAVNVISTPVAFWTIDSLGRRPLLIWGAVGMAICEFIVAIVGTTTSSGGGSAHIVLIVFVCIYIFFFASTWGPTGWAVSGEVFPLTIRSKGIALSTASNWLFNFLIAYFTPYFVDEDKANLKSKVFFIWGSTCALAALYSYFIVYETKGLSLEDCDKMMRETFAWNSSKWKPASERVAADAEVSAAPALDREARGESKQKSSWWTLPRKTSTKSEESVRET